MKLGFWDEDDEILRNGFCHLCTATCPTRVLVLSLSWEAQTHSEAMHRSSFSKVLEAGHCLLDLDLEHSGRTEVLCGLDSLEASDGWGFITASKEMRPWQLPRDVSDGE